MVGVFAGCASSLPKRTGGLASATLGALHLSPLTPATPSTGISDGGQTTTTLVAPQDPSTSSVQNVERTDEKATVMSVPVERVTETTYPNGNVVKVTESLVPTPVTLSKTTQKSESSVGASQVNMGSNVQAKLNSWRPVQFLGIALILGALACFHPIVFLAINKNRTMQIAAGASGFACLILPSLIVGNEKLLLYISLAIVAGFVVWHFIHDHGRLQGFVDKDGDGVDDRNQNSTLSKRD
jgi:hypothetical protein